MIPVRNVAIFVGAFVCVVIVGAVVAHPHSKVVNAKIESVKFGTFETKLPESGILERPRSATLSAPSSGTLVRITVISGQRIHAGMIVAVIANSQISDSVQTAYATYVAANARAEAASVANAVLPLQNRSVVVQAEATLKQASLSLIQARQDVGSGTQSGLGYGGTSAGSQRAAADAQLASAQTQMRESERIYVVNQDLFANKGISRDALEQSKSKYDQDRISLDQAQRQREETYAGLARQMPVLANRVVAAQEAVRQASAALASARATASSTKEHDVAAAQADAAARRSEWLAALHQADSLELRAPFDAVVESVASQASDRARLLQPGDAVSASQALVTISSADNFVVRTKVDEQDIAAVAVGQHAEIGGEDLGGRKLAGRVVEMDAVAQKSDDPANTSRQVMTTIRLDQTLPYLRDGMTVDVDIATRRVQRVITVENDAVRRDDSNRPFVFVVRNGRVVAAPVVLGEANESETIVTSGLVSGEQVVNDRNPLIVADVIVKALPNAGLDKSDAEVRK
jgi:multidrug efflux pump subunit AcrA (membrane-fusion protein)